MGMRDTVASSGTQQRIAGHPTKQRGQVSMEYMLVVGFMFAILVPLLMLYANTQQETQSAIAEGQALRFANTIRDAAERVYYAGEPAQETLLLTLPNGVEGARFDNTTIVYTLRGADGLYDLAISGLAPLNGTLPTRAGQYRVVVKAANETVYVTTN